MTDLFEAGLTVGEEDVEFLLREQCAVAWADFLLNPRRLRGSDFLMRWSQGVWSEKRLIAAVNETSRYVALPYGPSSVAPSDDVRESELYFEKLDAAGLGNLKRPDLLLFAASDRREVEAAVEAVGGEEQLPFTPEDDPHIKRLISRAIVAIECENSLWVAQKMPDYGSKLRAMRRLDYKPGLPKSAIVPTVILKEEDRAPLADWQEQSGLAIHIWHVFYDMAFGIALDEVERLIEEGLILGDEQVFQAPGGATTRKTIYKVYYHYAYPLGESREEPKLISEQILDKNGHILPYVRFDGGELALSEQAQEMLAEALGRRKG
jgi:hypothetical protein